MAGESLLAMSGHCAMSSHREVEQLLEARLLALQVVGPLDRAGLEVDFKLLPSAKPIELAPVLTGQQVYARRLRKAGLAE